MDTLPSLTIATTPVFPPRAWSLPARTRMFRFAAAFALPLLFGAASPVWSQPEVRPSVALVSGNREPYIGQNLPGHGYVHELVSEVFARAGYDIDIAFYPWARGQMMVRNGLTDGLVPTYSDHQHTNLLVYSDGFPGDSIGFIKRKTTDLPPPRGDVQSIDDYLERLPGPLRIGVTLGSPANSTLSHSDKWSFDYVARSTQSLEMLGSGRVDLVLMDKFTAADTIANELPHLIGKMDFIELPLPNVSFHIAFPRHQESTPRLISDFNRSLREVREDGTLETILRRHGLYSKNDADSEKTVLSIGTVDNPDMHVMQELSGEFERLNPDIDLHWQVMDETILRQRLISDLAISDGQFDVITIGTYETPIWAQRGWLTPLHESALPSGYDLPDIIEPIRKALSYHGTAYALPFYGESSMTYYRTDLFAQHALTMPDNPSYALIEAFAARLHDPENGVYGICLRGKPGWGENMALLTSMANSFGGQWFDGNWRTTLNTPAWQAALGQYQTLLLKYGAPNPTRNGFTELLGLFSQGRCAMWIDATVASGFLFDPSRSIISDKVGFASAPTGNTDIVSSWLWSWALGIPTSSKHTAAATRFIAWATSKQYIETVAEHKGWLAIPPGTRTSTYTNQSYIDSAPFSQFVKAALDSTEQAIGAKPGKPYNGIQYAGIPEFPAIGNYVGRQIAAAMEGQLTLEVALGESQNRAQLILNKSRFYGSPQ